METFTVKDGSCATPILGQNNSFNNTPTPFRNNANELDKNISNTFLIKEPSDGFIVSFFWSLTILDLSLTIIYI